ncbi:MAG: RagB/SusD family nutrient uptake outer membrane protein, partial [Saprospiraceae bacterium]
MKKYILTIFLFTLLFSSCENYLEEDFLSGENSQSIVSSEATFETLINSAYVSLRAWYGKENAWDLTEAGTDLYTWGLDNRSQGFCTYATFTTAEEQQRVGAIWRELYKALNTCNIILAEIDNVPYSSPALKEQRRGEVKFLRAHYLWLISEIWGGVHFTTEPSQEATKTANRTPVETFRQQIIEDLLGAVEVVPVEYGSNDYGRVTKPAVEAMLARVYLYMEDYAKAAEYSQKVMNDYNFSLLTDWTQIWDVENIQNEEVIWSVNYSDDPVFTKAGFTDPDGDVYNTFGIIQREGGHTGHVMFEIRYENLGWGLTRDVENGRGFQRWGPTKHFIDLFEEDYDQRFLGSFKTVWKTNDIAATPKWRPFVFVDGVRNPIERDLWAKPMFEIGDTAIVFSKKPVPLNKKGKFSERDIFYVHPTSGYLIIDINDMYLPDGRFNDNVINRQFYFPITKKYEDPTRPQLSTAFSKRDAFVFRISEMYLIAAEA